MVMIGNRRVARPESSKGVGSTPGPGCPATPFAPLQGVPPGPAAWGRAFVQLGGRRHERDVSMRRRLRFASALGVLALSLGLSDGLRAGGTDAGAVRFNRDVRPILSQRCFSCHGPDQKKAGLDLQSR